MNSFKSILIRWIVPLVGAGLALSAIFYLYRGLDFGRLLIELQNTKFRWIVMLAAAILLEQLVQGWKWRQLLFEIKPISSWRLMGAFLSGYGANVMVPIGVSPLVRSWLVARLESLRIASVLVTTATSRFVDGIVFAIIAGIVAMSGQIPNLEGNLQAGLAAAGALNLAIFSTILWMLFTSRVRFSDDASIISRTVDWIADKSRGKFGDLRTGLSEGIIWPKNRQRQVNIVVASFTMKAIAATHFLWAGLAVGVLLPPMDYLFLMVFAGFGLVLARFVRVPGGFVIGSGFALKLLGVADETALAMILFNHMITLILVVGIGLMVLWRSGVDIRNITMKTKLN